MHFIRELPLQELLLSSPPQRLKHQRFHLKPLTIKPESLLSYSSPSFCFLESPWWGFQGWLWPPSGRCTGWLLLQPWASPTAPVGTPSCAYLWQHYIVLYLTQQDSFKSALWSSECAADFLPKKGSRPTHFLRHSTMGWPNVMLGTKCLRGGNGKDQSNWEILSC